jgi:hypothetical protein
MLKKASYLLAAFSLLLTGCTLEQKLAKTYVKQNPLGRILLLEPSIVFKSNLKTYEIPGVDTLAEYLKDSLLLDKSLFLKDVSDSLLIREFVSGFKKYFELSGAVVLTESSIDTLMEKGGTPYIMNIAQFSLEEFLHPYSSEQLIYDEVLVIDGFDVNAINYNVWIELSRLNTEKKNKVLFTSDYITDDVNGVLRQNLFTGKAIYDYTIDTITTAREYEFARKFGETTAGLIFDYLLNTYILENLPDNYPYDPYYYHYDPERKVFFATDEDQRIIELEDK